MRVSTFIGVSSLLLAFWLGVSFLREVPTGSYPVLDRSFASTPADNTLASNQDAPPLEP